MPKPGGRKLAGRVNQPGSYFGCQVLPDLVRTLLGSGSFEVVGSLEEVPLC